MNFAKHMGKTNNDQNGGLWRGNIPQMFLDIP